MVCSPQEPLTHSRLVNKRIHIIVVGRGEEGDIIGGDGVKRSNTKIGPSITDSIAKKNKKKKKRGEGEGVVSVSNRNNSLCEFCTFFVIFRG